MKTFLLITTFISLSMIGFGQNINDNDVSFPYIQLPLIKVDKAFDKYEIRVEHLYKQANEDSMELYELRVEAAEDYFEKAKQSYQRSRDSIDRAYLYEMGNWEKKVNSGVTSPNGTPLPQPAAPVYPDAPVFPVVKTPHLHSDYDASGANNDIQVEGFKNGLGGFIITVNLQPLGSIKINESKKGTGSSTKYHYTCEYTMPVTIKVETPTQGVILEQIILGGTQSYGMNEQKSHYDHLLYMMDNEDKFYRDLETYARGRAMKEANSYINDQIGYVTKVRRTEIYSVKKFKDYDYSDITNAYTATVQALSLVKNDRDRSGAQAKLEAAYKMWEEIMLESNTYDNKARVNDKISAMIQCNMAEILAWQSKFNEADAMLNLIKNSSVSKGKSHAKKVDSFYARLKSRWEVNY